MSDPGPTLAVLERLVAFPTVSSRSNLDLVAYAEALLGDAGIATRRVANAEGTKANLHAVIGPPDLPGVMLSGHTDVVPVEGQAWTSDPFRLARRDGRLYGRGTADMKGFVAAALNAARNAAGRRLARPLHLALSYDEEVGCLGVRGLIEALAAGGTPSGPLPSPLPALCLVGEPTAMRPTLAHKGKLGATIACRGRAGHSSDAPANVNAIHLACDMVGVVRALQDEVAARGRRDDAYSTPYTTLHVGTIAGGRAVNIVPDACTVAFEIRHLPEDDPGPLLERLRERAARLTGTVRARDPAAGVAVEATGGYPGLLTAPASEAARWIAGLAGTDDAGKVAYGTEAGLFAQDLGIGCVVCGPGDIAQAHRPDEFVTLDQLGRCDAMLARLVDGLAA